VGDVDNGTEKGIDTGPVGRLRFEEFDGVILVRFFSHIAERVVPVDFIAASIWQNQLFVSASFTSRPSYHNTSCCKSSSLQKPTVRTH
jgi:hypothetical protein